MKRLEVDFNDRTENDRVRVGPSAAARHAFLQDARAGERVEAVDMEGNRCLGTLVAGEARPNGTSWVVELDWSTWQDAGKVTTNGAAVTDAAHSPTPTS